MNCSDRTTWAPLYKTGAIAILVAAILFRRNIGAEVSLFTGVDAIPASTVEWFNLLQSNPFVGLSFLAVFDLLNYALLGVMFLALAAALWQANRSMVALALASGLAGITIGFATNISLTMLSLSQQYAAANAETQQAALLAAGQAVLAMNDPLAAYPSTGVYTSLLLITLASLLFASLLLCTHRATGIMGLLAAVCDLSYCLLFPLGTALPVYLLLAVAGLFWMIWHLLVARILFKFSKEAK